MAKPTIKKKAEWGPWWEARCPGEHATCVGEAMQYRVWDEALAWVIRHQLFYTVGLIGECERCKQRRPLFPHVQKKITWTDPFDTDEEHCATCTCSFDDKTETVTLKRRLCIYCHQDEPMEINLTDREDLDA